MTKKRSTKRALALSFISLLLCVSMFVGTTFAWFTDSVSSVNNVIKAGNLDVELEYWNGTEWADVSENTNVFEENTLWEPGHTEVVYLKVSNLGTLALKYQLGINVASEILGKTEDGKDIKLSDYLVFKAVDITEDKVGTFTREAAKAEAGTEIGIKAYNSGAKKLEKQNDANYVALIVYMPETVGNEANYRGTDIPTINLGINLFATQLDYEEDSFGNDYDKNSAVFTVADANAQMAENLDVTLVNCNEPEGILEAPANYTGTLTIVNSTVKSVQAAGNMNLVVLGDVVVNANGTGATTLAATAFDGSAITANGKLSVSGKGNLTAIAADVKGAFGIGGMNTTEISIKDITIDYVSGSFAYGVGSDTTYYKDAPEGGAAIGSGYRGANITLDNVTVTKAIGGSKAAGIGARYWTGVNVTITNSEILYVEGGVSSAGIGGSRVQRNAGEDQSITINITNSTVTAKGGAYGAGIGSGYDTYCQSKQPLCTINITDSTINATGGRYAAGVGTGYHNAALAGEIKNSTVNAVSGEKFYKDTYTAAMDVGFGVTDPAREGVQGDSYIILNGNKITLAEAPDVVDDTDELKAALASGETNIQLATGTYTLTSLSGLKGVTIEGIGDVAINGVNSFNFGEDTVVKNITFKTSGGHSVRYATTSGNVVYENCVFEGRQYGYHVDNANGGTITFNNCTFYGRNALASNGTYFFNGCTFEYTYSNYNTTNIYSEATFNNCKWDSKLELSIASGAKAIIDGETITQRVVFISDARGLESFQQSVNWQNNTYAGVTVMLSADIDMNDAYYAKWTPIGQTGATQFQGTFDGHGYTIKNLNIDTSKQTGANYAVGLFGWLNKATVKNLTVETATVTGNHNVGVIAGYMETAGCTISNCHVVGATVVANHANDDACGDKVGVIVGHAGNSGVKVENCSAKESTVTAGRDAGQIAGAALTANVTGCTATNVTVTANGQCTGANVNNAVIGRVLG